MALTRVGDVRVAKPSASAAGAVEADAQHGAVVALALGMLDDDLEAPDPRETRDSARVHLRRMHEHALDLADRAHLPDEDDARRRVAARARARQQPEDVARRVAHERQRRAARAASRPARRCRPAPPARRSPDRGTRRRDPRRGDACPRARGTRRPAGRSAPRRSDRRARCRRCRASSRRSAGVSASAVEKPTR